MKITTACKAITKAYSTLNDIENDNDLKRERLTVAEYHAACDIFPELSTPGNSAQTFIKSVAEFYARAGFTVKPGTVNFTITTAE